MSTSHAAIWFLLLAMVCADADEPAAGTDGVLVPDVLVFNESNPHRWTDPHERIFGVRCPDGHSEPIGGIEADTGEILFECGSSVAVWNIVTGKFRISLEGHSGQLSSIATRGDLVAASGVDSRVVRTWSLKDGQPVSNWTIPRDVDILSRAITCLAIGNESIYVGTDRGTVLAWHHQSRNCMRLFVASSNIGLSSITCMWASVDDERLLFGAQDGSVREYREGLDICTVFWAPDAVWYVTAHPWFDNVVAISTREDVLIVKSKRKKHPVIFARNTNTYDLLQRKPGSASAIFFDCDDNFIWQQMGSQALTLSSITTGKDIGEMSSFPPELKYASTFTFILARRHKAVILMPDSRGDRCSETIFALLVCGSHEDRRQCMDRYYACLRVHGYPAVVMRRGYADRGVEELNEQDYGLCRLAFDY